MKIDVKLIDKHQKQSDYPWLILFTTSSSISYIFVLFLQKLPRVKEMDVFYTFPPLDLMNQSSWKYLHDFEA